MEHWNREEIEKPIEVHSVDDLILAISTDGNRIVSGSGDGSIRQWDSRTGKQVGEDNELPDSVKKIVISNDGQTIAGGSRHGNYVQKWETKTGKTICEPMKWSEGEHMLDEMERARLCGDQECNAIVRKDTIPIETSCRAVCPDKKKNVVGLEKGKVAVCEWR